MTTHKEIRADLDSALHTLTHPHRKVEDHQREAPTKPMRHFHAHELHDGTYHVEKDHGEGPMETGSANDLDEVHDHLEEMMGTPNEGEQEGEEHKEHSHH